MDPMGINQLLLIAQLVNLFLFLLFILWPILTIVALFGLRQRKLEAIPRALWAMTIVFMPVLGAAAFWIVRPEEFIS